MIKLLLKHGANMGVKNNEEKAPVKRILPDTLKEFLDDCIESEGKDRKINVCIVDIININR